MCRQHRIGLFLLAFGIMVLQSNLDLDWVELGIIVVGAFLVGTILFLAEEVTEP